MQHPHNLHAVVEWPIKDEVAFKTTHTPETQPLCLSTLELTSLPYQGHGSYSSKRLLSCLKKAFCSSKIILSDIRSNAEQVKLSLGGFQDDGRHIALAILLHALRIPLT